MTHVERLQQVGIRRLGSKERGFRYVHANGKPASAAEAKRIQLLRIPPAWTDVFVAPNDRAKVQCVGRDKAGRWQYRYAESFVRRRDQAKYEKLVSFAESLPKLRRQLARDLSRPGLPKEKVLACTLRVLACCFIRAGSARYAAQNGSFGIATLRPKHVKVHGRRVTFDFPGKFGKRQVRQLEDARVAAIVRRMMAIPGKELFKFIDEEGNVVDLKRRHINAYIKGVMGERYSAKDFRTWAGTLICACALARVGFDPAESQRVRRKKVVQAVKQTAEVLGNTPAVCKSAYIFPSVLSSYERGKTVEKYFDSVDELARPDSAGLHVTERAVLEFLRGEAGASAGA